MNYIKRHRLITITLLILSVINVQAGDLDKAFKYLNTGDYANAQKYMREVLTDEPTNAAANWGMAKYFSSRDNKAYNLDSANASIKAAASKIPLPEEDKETKKFLALGVRDYTIQTLQKSINFDAYAIAEQQNTFESYQHFVDVFTDPIMLEQAITFRNQKAYTRALSTKSVDAIKSFIKNYPQAKEAADATKLYEKMLYEQLTADQSIESYKKYIDTYPNCFYFKQAQTSYFDKVFQFYARKNTLDGYKEYEVKYKSHPKFLAIQDSIYKLATQAGTVEAYRNFVNNYTQNVNLDKAWNQLYILYTVNATPQIYASFLAEFQKYPNRDKVQRDMVLSAKELKPIQQSSKWGYVYQPTPDSLIILIPGEYEEAFEFKNGYAVVRSKPCNDKCAYSYIDKNNQRAFAGEFNFAGDFNNGVATVGIGNCETSDCKYGMIDKLGRFVIPAQYQEIDEPTEGLYLAIKDDKYGFLNSLGETVITHKYTDALPFKMGLAAVAIDGNWFFIDKTGAQKFINRFLDVSSFSDSLCAVTQDKETWGYIDFTGAFVIQPLYETAEDFENGFAIISKKEKDPKNKALLISQRYKIDKAGKTIEKLMAPKEPTKKPTRKTGKR